MASPRLAIISLIAIALGASTTSACAMPQNLASASMPSASGSSPEIVAAPDSRGRVHVFWTERSSTPGEPEQTLLWYSTYDPEAEGARTGHVLDGAPAIYSLALTVDEHDMVHAVWVSATDSFETVPGVTQAVVDERRLNIVNYLTIDSTGSVLGPRRPLFGSPSESLWVSVASARNSGPYLAWTDVHRVGRIRQESATYYTSLSRDNVRSTAAPTFVTKNENPSKMLRTTVSAEYNKLYLAWVDEYGDGRSGISCSSVDLSGTATRTIRMGEVEGDIDRLALTPTQDGSVLVGWTYEAKSRAGPVFGMAKLERDETTLATDIDIPLPGSVSALESMTVDSRGNFHILWADAGEDLHIGPGSPRVAQAVIHYAVMDNEGRFSAEDRRPIHLPVTAAFFVESGDVYVVSSGAVLESAQPTVASNPSFFLFAILLSVCFTIGMTTEAGSYALARWKTVGRPVKNRDCMDLSGGRENRLVRRIRARPGIALSELRAFTSLGTIDLASRLRLLEASGTIHSLRQGTKRRFYCLDSPDLAGPRTSEVRSSIISLVGKEPGITERNIARQLEMSQQLANYHLRRLTRAMVLSRRLEGGRVGYFLDERAIASLRKAATPSSMQDAYKWKAG